MITGEFSHVHQLSCTTLSVAVGSCLQYTHKDTQIIRPSTAFEQAFEFRPFLDHNEPWHGARSGAEAHEKVHSVSLSISKLTNCKATQTVASARSANNVP